MTPRQWTCVRSQYVYLPTVYQLFCLVITVIITHVHAVSCVSDGHTENLGSIWLLKTRCLRIDFLKFTDFGSVSHL